MSGAVHGRVHAVSWLLAVLLTGLSVIAAWRVVAHTQAERWATSDPERALSWVPNHPKALLTLAEAQLTAGHLDAATASARRLLAVEPLKGSAFGILGQAAAARGQEQEALALYRIAVRRSPRDVTARAWLIDHALRTRDFQQALQQLDSLLRISPQYGSALMPLLGQLAADSEFASELGRTLKRRPPWRGAFLTALQRVEDPLVTDRILAVLRSEGGLNSQEFEEWLDYLMRRGRWGEAYGRWASNLDLDRGPLRPVYNGGFEQPVTGRGFQWRMTRVPGVSVEFVPDRGAQGLVAHASFRGRPVPHVNLEQPLLLSPGRHRLTARVRAKDLRSERGLEWSISCEGKETPFANSDPIQGTFGWRKLTMELDVPSEQCEGQWLRVRNPVGPGSIQQVSGDLWFDDVAIE